MIGVGIVPCLRAQSLAPVIEARLGWLVPASSFIVAEGRAQYQPTLVAGLGLRLCSVTQPTRLTCQLTADISPYVRAQLRPAGSEVVRGILGTVSLRTLIPSVSTGKVSVVPFVGLGIRAADAAYSAKCQLTCSSSFPRSAATLNATAGIRVASRFEVMIHAFRSPDGSFGRDFLVAGTLGR
jgi:hypothetical protein